MASPQRRAPPLKSLYFFHIYESVVGYYRGVPDGAPFFIAALVLSKVIGHGWAAMIPSPRRLDMLDSMTAPKIDFVIETLYQGKSLELYWRLTQAVGGKGGEREQTGLYNSVQGYLSDLSVRTGFDYRILSWGLPCEIDAYLRYHQLELF